MNFEFDRHMGEKIRNIREQKGMTQAELAAKLQTIGCDITRSAIAKIEVGQRHIYSWEIKAIKNALGTGYEELLG